MGKMNKYHNKGNDKYRKGSSNNSERYHYKNRTSNQHDVISQSERREFGIKTSYKKLLRQEGRKGALTKPVNRDLHPISIDELTPMSTTLNWTVTINDGDQKLDSKIQGKRKGFSNKPSSLKKAQNEFHKREEESRNKITKAKQQLEEREFAIISRKKKRFEKFKILNQKTRKGQPVMKGRIQLLLNKIQSNIS